MVRVVLGLLEQCGDMVVIEAVLDLVALTPYGLDEASVSKQAEVMRNRRLARTDGERKVTDAERLAYQCVEDLRPRGVAEGTKSLDHQLEDLLVRKALTGVRHGVQVDGEASGCRCHLSDYIFIPVQILSNPRPTDRSSDHWSGRHILARAPFVSPGGAIDIP